MDDNKFDQSVVDDHIVCTDSGTSILCTIIVLVLSLTVNNFNLMHDQCWVLSFGTYRE